jgi:hypothetical protein
LKYKQKRRESVGNDKTRKIKDDEDFELPTISR